MAHETSKKAKNLVKHEVFEAPPVGLERPHQTAEENVLQSENGAEMVHLVTRATGDDCRLELLVDAWPTLPEAAKRQIMYIIQEQPDGDSLASHSD